MIIKVIIIIITYPATDLSPSLLSEDRSDVYFAEVDEDRLNESKIVYTSNHSIFTMVCLQVFGLQLPRSDTVDVDWVIHILQVLERDTSAAMHSGYSRFEESFTVEGQAAIQKRFVHL